MTQLLEGTELAPVGLPEGMVGFGLAEVAYLLSRHDTPAVKRAYRLFDLDDGIDLTDDFLRSGASSLFARGFLRQNTNGTSTTLSAAALMEYVTGANTSQTVVEIVSAQSMDAAVVLIAPEVLATLQPRAMGTWFASFTDAVADAPRLMFEVLRAALKDYPESSVALITVGDDAPKKAIFARFDDETGRWDVVDRTVDGNNERRELLDEYALRGRLAALVRAH